jgi:predicted amidohydrolase
MPLDSKLNMKISVATCHFPVDADITRNEEYVVSQVRSARELGADVAHFPEACLSGYAEPISNRIAASIGPGSKQPHATFSMWPNKAASGSSWAQRIA